MLKRQEELNFSPYVDLYEKLIPQDHIFRRINELVDFTFIIILSFPSIFFLLHFFIPRLLHDSVSRKYRKKQFCSNTEKESSCCKNENRFYKQEHVFTPSIRFTDTLNVGIAIAVTRTFLTIETYEDRILLIRIAGEFICRENVIFGFVSTLIIVSFSFRINEKQYYARII